ncbi:extracellular solute-binding protein [Paenibacillus contaminans]|uniref:ABC transporter substrate-binding protein n=1 Tax=Paenibacillus contaminans TaxID=450362 RepID=A0A329MIP5_9BACL|nr:extracellular solute-binding protein [Paenibacillus contaminans]RAV19709.1 ABC transporter substrate-binding protein [Paenibacillus contaminans]
MRKTTLGAALAIAMMLPMLAACGGGTESGASSSSPSKAPSPSGDVKAPSEQAASAYGDTGGLKLPLVDKSTKISWMVVSETPVNEKLIAQEIKKRTGITVDFQAYPKSTYQDKLRVILASGKIPDIFHGLNAVDLKKMGKQKVVVAINEFADQLPNFKKLYMQENAWVLKSYGDENGNLYTWPIYSMNRDVNHGFLYRKDIFDKNNIPAWTDTEGFYQALKKLKEIYPQSYPLSSKTSVGIFRDYAYGWGIGGASYPMYYDETKKQWKFAPTQPENKAMLDFMKKLYNEGLLDPEFITSTADSWTSKMTTGKSFVTFDWIGRLDLFYNQVRASNPDYNLRYGYPVGPTGHVRTLSKIDTSLNIAVANNENKEIALKLLDYMTSPSGSQLMSLGVEGQTFTLDKNNKAVYPELKDVPLVDITVLNDKYGLWLEGATLRPDSRSVYFNFTEKEKESQDLIVSKNLLEPADPVLNFTDEETAKLAELQASLQKAAEEFDSKYVIDKAAGEKDWENWKAGMEKNGAYALEAIYNAAQSRLNRTN